jgi:outer membrane protein assembly factor BamB
MLTFTRADGRRVFVLGVAGLVPAALVTLLLVHQPSVGERRLYPMLRVPLTVVGLALALATLAAWAADLSRFSRRTLSGAAWAGLTVTLCIGPLLESTPRARLYALELGTGEVTWLWKRAVTDPVLVDGDLVVTDIGSDDRIGLDPETGDERWRRAAIAEDGPPSLDVDVPSGPRVVDGAIRGAGDASPWTLSWPGDTVVVVTRSGSDGYAYVTTPGADGSDGGAIVSFDVEDGAVRWRVALPESVVVGSGTPAIGASGDAVVVAGGERVAALSAGNGQVRWSSSIASLGKSRGYVLPGSVQQVIVTEAMVYLLATPQT